MSEPTVPSAPCPAAESPRVAEPRRAPGGPQRKASRALRTRFAARLREHRRARGWTQQQLAKYCHCPKNFISNLERGTVNATLATLEMLARALHCCESDLLVPLRVKKALAESFIQHVTRS